MLNNQQDEVDQTKKQKQQELVDLLQQEIILRERLRQTSQTFNQSLEKQTNYFNNLISKSETASKSLSSFTNSFNSFNTNITKSTTNLDKLSKSLASLKDPKINKSQQNTSYAETGKIPIPLPVKIVESVLIPVKMVSLPAGSGSTHYDVEAAKGRSLFGSALSMIHASMGNTFGGGGDDKPVKKDKWTKVRDFAKGVESASHIFDNVSTDAGRSLASFGSTLQSLPQPVMQAAGAITELVGGAISKLGEEGRKQKQIIVSSFVSQTQATRTLGSTMASVRTNTLTEGLRRASEALTSGNWLDSAGNFFQRLRFGIGDLFGVGGGGNLAGFEAQNAIEQARSNQTQLNRIQTDPTLRNLRNQVLVSQASGSLLGQVESNVNNTRGSRASRFRLEAGGTEAQARDSGSMAQQFSALSQAMNMDIGQVMVLFDPMIRQLRESQRLARGAEFGAQATLRNQYPLERVRRRDTGLQEAIGTGDMNASQSNREAANIFRELVDSMGPIERLTPALVYGSQAVLTASRMSDIATTQNDPQALLLYVQREALTRQTRVEEYNRQMAEALNTLMGRSNIAPVAWLWG